MRSFLGEAVLTNTAEIHDDVSGPLMLVGGTVIGGQVSELCLRPCAFHLWRNSWQTIAWDGLISQSFCQTLRFIYQVLNYSRIIQVAN